VGVFESIDQELYKKNVALTGSIEEYFS